MSAKKEAAGAINRQGQRAPFRVGDEEIERASARLRHFRGVAASVLSEALVLWREIWLAFDDPRNCLEILDGRDGKEGIGAASAETLQKLHELGIKIEYARRLCEGHFAGESRDEKEDG